MDRAIHSPVKCKAEEMPNENTMWQFLYNQNRSAFSGEVNL